jgi:hypothetical protein
MQQTGKPASKVKMALVWAFFIGNLVFWCGFWIWWNRGRSPEVQSAPDLLRGIVMLILGGFFVMAGVASYLIVIFTQCFTFNFQRPMWDGLKARLYLANIIVPLLPALGFGLALSSFLSPALTALGLGSTAANLLPVFAMVALLQTAQIWVQVWAPLERRVISRRLQARDITPDQLRGAVLVGTSNPLRSSFKKLTTVEEDVGALWIGPDRLVYCGDVEQYAITRPQLVQLERKADAGSVSMLVGITHVILHVHLPDGSERQIRLHVEGLWTMGQKRRAMDALADNIARWHARPEPGSPPAIS